MPAHYATNPERDNIRMAWPCLSLLGDLDSREQSYPVYPAPCRSVCRLPFMPKIHSLDGHGRRGLFYRPPHHPKREGHAKREPPPPKRPLSPRAYWQPQRGERGETGKRGATPNAGARGPMPGKRGEGSTAYKARAGWHGLAPSGGGEGPRGCSGPRSAPGLLAVPSQSYIHSGGGEGPRGFNNGPTGGRVTTPGGRGTAQPRRPAYPQRAPSRR